MSDEKVTASDPRESALRAASAGSRELAMCILLDGILEKLEQIVERLEKVGTTVEVAVPSMEAFKEPHKGTEPVKRRPGRPRKNPEAS